MVMVVPVTVFQGLLMRKSARFITPVKLASGDDLVRRNVTNFSVFVFSGIRENLCSFFSNNDIRQSLYPALSPFLYTTQTRKEHL